MNSLNLYTAPEIMQNYVELGKKKTLSPALKLLLLGVASGIMIGLGGVVVNTAVHAVDNPGLLRLIGGLIFPFGLGVVILTGMELFTGNCMIITSVLDKKATLAGMLRNWFYVYLGNLAGGLMLSAGIVASGQLDLNGGLLAAYTIKVAAFKCGLAFGPALILGIFCNLIVCLAVLCSLAAKDVAGRILGAYIPIAFFVISGFEHSVANMYFIPAGILAMLNPDYAAVAAAAGVDTAALSWSGFFISNLIPVTLGNIIGGAAIAVLLWVSHNKMK